ncbi:cobyrinic acid a,c-diamide synthase [Spirulina subsalsa FACHB-351]|uniref:Cobyrinic acid a,c-diamide synthase n=1 Tax=Spirulina subsalsa FACHB-351 TaxID=234711 RepID=A0ABT3L5S1_9CYAN|nr:cobyrinic acid a,c-diamide synthase [Spirulina subsalsa]MCW6036860.1 cobyrinic acid a,c-diamide synthase [Spirulina subsalsa FACHB-351]
MLEKVPQEAKEWAEGLDWQRRRYLLSLCHLLCGASPEIQAGFLDQYTADGLLAKIIQDYETYYKVQRHLDGFHINTQLNNKVLRQYIKQFYIHSAQDVRREPQKYLEAALRLVFSPEEKSYVLNYILGFELIKLLFKMSWLQQERFYSLQNNQEDFYHTYIKPVQYAQRVNGLVIPKDEKTFFSQREFYVTPPKISGKRLEELVMVTFTTDAVSTLGFSIVRNIRPVPFDYDYIYQPAQERIF